MRDRALIRLLVGLTVLNHIAFTGSRVAVPLGALELHASPFAVGMLLSCYALLPMLLSVSAGRWIDRIGIRIPTIAGTVLLAVGVLLPFLSWRIEAMYLGSVALGLGMMAHALAAQQAAGLIGGDDMRVANFSLLALGFSASGFLGPTTAGATIDLLGHRWAFGMLALAPLLTLLVLLRSQLARRLPAPVAQVGPAAPRGRLLDLLATPELRRLYLAVVLLSSAWDVHQFLVPLYGAQMGIAASQIGLVLGAFSLATFLVRMALPLINRRVGPWPLVLTALSIAALVYLAYPLLPLLAWMFALSFLLGLGLGVAQPMVMVVMHRASPRDRVAEAGGLRMTLVNGTQAFLPSAFGAFGAAFGLSAIFWGMSALIAAGSLHVFLGLRHERRH